MSATEDWPAADVVTPPGVIRSWRLAVGRRPWLPPVVGGVVGGIALSAVWASIASGAPCFIAARSLGFGLLVLLLLGSVATAGVGLAVASERPMRRRVGKVLLLGSLAGVLVFLVLTSILPIVMAPCPA